MGLFKRLKEKRAKAKEQKRIDEEIKLQEKNKAEKKATMKAKPVKEEKPGAKSAPSANSKPVEKKEEVKETKPAKTERKVSGKYEVYPEAGLFKFSLKASNGEILLVSNGYKTRDGAKRGIATLKKYLPTGIKKIIKDKNGYYQFRLNTANDARVIITGEIYPTKTVCSKALDSTLKFGDTTKIVDLDEIPDSEIREWIVSVPGEKRANGKIELYIDDVGKWRARLLASNGEILFVTPSYVSKRGLENGLRTIKARVADNSFHIVRDKQNRYQFQLMNESSQLLLTGETYPDKNRAVSAADSVRGFLPEAAVIDTVAEAKAKEKAEAENRKESK